SCAIVGSPPTASGRAPPSPPPPSRTCSAGRRRWPGAAIRRSCPTPRTRSSPATRPRARATSSSMTRSWPRRVSPICPSTARPWRSSSWISSSTPDLPRRLNSRPRPPFHTRQTAWWPSVRTVTAPRFNPGHEMQHETFGDILLERSTDDHTGLLFEDSSWTWREFVAESAVRAEILGLWSTEFSDHYAGRPERYRRLHVGILLENVPEYLFVLCGAALAGVTVIGINPTRRGTELAADIRSVDCDVIVTDGEGRLLLDGLETGVAAIHDIDSELWQRLLTDHREATPALAEDARDPEALLALLFTSGSTGAPKAVMCSTGRLAMLGTVHYRNLVRDDVAYSAMPLFHGNALFAAFAPCAYVGSTFALRRKFSASGFLPDVLRFGATYVNYVGRSLSYILAQPERPEESQTKLRIVFGTEASVHDRAEFERRFHV